MKTIYKYQLETNDTVTIAMPYGSETLTVQTQHGNVFIWAIIDDEEQVKFWKTFKIFGTGHKLPENISDLKYVGTYQLYGGNLVFHVFEVIS